MESALRGSGAAEFVWRWWGRRREVVRGWRGVVGVRVGGRVGRVAVMRRRVAGGARRRRREKVAVEGVWVGKDVMGR